MLLINKSYKTNNNLTVKIINKADGGLLVGLVYNQQGQLVAPAFYHSDGTHTAGMKSWNIASEVERDTTAIPDQDDDELSTCTHNWEEKVLFTSSYWKCKNCGEELEVLMDEDQTA